jgi:hypothetical protein
MRRALVFVLFLASLGWTALAAAAPTLRVRGGSTIRMVALDRGDGGVLVRGAVTDDVGATMGRVTIRVSLNGAALVPVRPCTDSEGFGAAPRIDGTFYSVVTDERGAFCFVYPRTAAGLVLTAKFVGNNTFEGSETTAKATPESEQRADTLLRFEPVPGTIDLDRETVTVTASLRIDRDDSLRVLPTAATRRDGLVVKLTDERGTVLAETPTGGDGRVRFELKTKALAGPGNGELIADFGGNEQLGASKATAFVTRTATVHLGAPTDVKGDPEAGIALDVDVTTPFGGVDGGVVEATLAGDSVGAAQVDGGKAHLVLTFAGEAAARIPVRLSYAPSAPFYRRGEAVDVTIVAEGPSLVRQLVLAAAVLALGLWIVIKWRRAPKAEQKESLLPPPPSGRPEMLVLDRPSGLKGWRGFVHDAHDGHPIAGVELRVLAPSLSGKNVVAEVTTDADGSFAIDVAAPRESRLVVEGELHATYEQALPPPSVLRIALVTRRRALLDRLVRWARSKGTPFDSHREPTPGHVRRAAARAGADKVETWARKVEHAAFGPNDVTRQVEDEIAGAEPGAGRAPFVSRDNEGDGGASAGRDPAS